MRRIDPDQRFVDTVFFDGASNVQKAGRLISSHFPSVTVLHGSEHVSSLIFSDWAKKIPVMQCLIRRYKSIYMIFGSGSHHKPHAILKKYSSQHFSGKYVGLIRAADTRMAGYFIALTRMLRLKDALMSTIHSVEFKQHMQTKGKKKEEKA